MAPSVGSASCRRASPGMSWPEHQARDSAAIRGRRRMTWKCLILLPVAGELLICRAESEKNTRDSGLRCRSPPSIWRNRSRVRTPHLRIYRPHAFPRDRSSDKGGIMLFSAPPARFAMRIREESRRVGLQFRLFWRIGRGALRRPEPPHFTGSDMPLLRHRSDPSSDF